jgi:hypothetical protein
MTTPAERRLRAQIHAHESWARTEDRSARTLPARQAAEDRFEKLVDPEGKLPPAERAKRAENARKAHYRRIALLSAQSRPAAVLAQMGADSAIFIGGKRGLSGGAPGLRATYIARTPQRVSGGAPKNGRAADITAGFLRALQV